jgi:hypothetical protein
MTQLFSRNSNVKQELFPVAKIAKSVAEIKLTTVCADIQICKGEGEEIQILAQTPRFWNVTDGRVTEVGGPVSEVLTYAVKDTVIPVNGDALYGGNIMGTTISGFFDGVFYVENERVTVPDAHEQLAIYLPPGFAGYLVIDAKYFGAISIDASLQGKVKATVSAQVSLTVV